MCLCPKWLQCMVSHVSANARSCALRTVAAAGWKHNILCHPWCDLQVGSCSGIRRLSQLLMAKRASFGGPLTAVTQLCYKDTSSALGKLHPFLLPGVRSCLKPWSCRFSARTPFRLDEPIVILSASWHVPYLVQCLAALLAIPGCPVPWAALGKSCPSQQPHNAWTEPGSSQTACCVPLGGLRGSEGGTQTCLKWMFGPLSHLLLQKKEQGTEMKFRHCQTFSPEAGFLLSAWYVILALLSNRIEKETSI